MVNSPKIAIITLTIGLRICLKLCLGTYFVTGKGLRDLQRRPGQLGRRHAAVTCRPSHRDLECRRRNNFFGFFLLFLLSMVSTGRGQESRATRRICEKVIQNVAQPIFCKNECLSLPVECSYSFLFSN
jgi:hypothetical protein